MKTLEDMLHEDATRPLLDDAFTRRVVAALPRRAPVARLWVRPAWVCASALAGAILAAVLAPAGFEVTQGLFDLASLRAMTPASVTAIAMALTLLASALVLAAAD
jgi:hypothetical protein